MGDESKSRGAPIPGLSQSLTEVAGLEAGERATQQVEDELPEDLSLQQEALAANLPDQEDRQRKNEGFSPKGGRCKNPEETQARNEQRFRQLVENAGDIIFETDAQGFFTFVNPVTLRITGYTWEDIAGRHYLDLVHPHYRKKATKLFDYEVIRADGERRNLELSIALRTDSKTGESHSTRSVDAAKVSSLLNALFCFLLENNMEAMRCFDSVRVMSGEQLIPGRF